MKQYEDLANAIILRAVDDYRDAMKKLKINPRYKSALQVKEECEQFFLSEWFCVLTTVDGESLLRKLKEEFE